MRLMKLMIIHFIRSFQRAYCAVLDPDTSAAEIPFPADGVKHLEQLRDITDHIPPAHVNPFIVSI